MTELSPGEEADEAKTDRDHPRRIDIGQNAHIDEPSLQHSTGKYTRKQKNDPKNKDSRVRRWERRRPHFNSDNNQLQLRLNRVGQSDILATMNFFF